MHSASGTRGLVSAIVPTIGRPDSLGRLLESLARQSQTPDEVIVADGSSNAETTAIVFDKIWRDRNLLVKRVGVRPPNAVRQRLAAIAASRGQFLLLLDDDVVLEPDCIERMTTVLLRDAAVVGVVADFNNQSWPGPTWAWRLYLRYVLRLQDGAWQGRVLGPLLRFGYSPTPKEEMPMEWLGGGNSMIRRSAYDMVGGFSNFFLHRSTMNEDVDLGLRISEVGKIVFCPAARMGHFHAPGGRVSRMIAAEDDLFNRFLVLHHTQHRSTIEALALVCLYFAVETTSSIGGCLRRFRGGGVGGLFVGRLRALLRIIARNHSTTD